MTPYDALLARRTAALGMVFAAIVYATMLGTDEAASTHAGRLGRLAALASLAGAGAVAVALAQARSRGEMRALAATGLWPGRAGFGAVVGGTLIGLVGAVLALLPGVDLTPLFPRALPTEAAWVAENGAWLDRARGIRVTSDGAMSWISAPAGADRGAASLPLAATLTALVVAAVTLPLWAAAPASLARRAAVSFAVASAAVFVFHLVAAHRIPAMTLIVPPSLLFADVWLLHRGRRWS